MGKLELIKELELEPHPEGGYYKEMYRSRLQVASENNAGMSASTAIYYLLGIQDFSHFHRLGMDEALHHYAGLTLSIAVLDSEKPEQYYIVKLGGNVSAGERPFFVIPSDHWFSLFISPQDVQNATDTDYALVGTTVAPGFDYRYFELGQRDNLLAEFPLARHLIDQFAFSNPDRQK